jgi:hypothetical protein
MKMIQTIKSNPKVRFGRCNPKGEFMIEQKWEFD